MRKQHWMLFGVFIIVIFLLYSKLFYLFYQQDEWFTIGTFFSGGMLSYLQQYSVSQILTGSGRVLSMIIYYPIYMLFPFQGWPFAFISILFHSINAYLLYQFSYTLTRKISFSLMAAVFFTCASISTQALAWFATSANALPSATFLLLSMILAVHASTKNDRKLFLWSQVCGIISFLFKESGCIAFVVSPLLYYFWNSGRNKHMNIAGTLWPYLCYGAFVFVVHVSRFLSAPIASGSSFVENSPYVWQKLAVHAFLYPIVSMSQIFIPKTIMFSIAKSFQTIMYSNLERFTSSQLGVESIVSDFVSFMLAILILSVLIYLAYTVRTYRRIIVFGIFFACICFWPFIIIEKQNSYLDSRYFYNGAMGGGLIVSAFIFGFIEYIRTKYHKLLPAAMVLLIIGIGTLLYKHVQYIQREINYFTIESTERIFFLKQLQAILPILPARSVLYVTGNNNGFYGIPQLKIPFQQGPGYTFMVWYYRNNVIPQEFVRDAFLWRVEDQGYRELNSMAFGYYYDIHALKKLVDDDVVDPSQVIGLYYDTESKKLLNITEEIRNTLNSSPAI